MHEISRNHSRNRGITLEISSLREIINKKSGNLSEIKKSILEIKRFRNLVQNIGSLRTPRARRQLELSRAQTPRALQPLYNSVACEQIADDKR